MNKLFKFLERLSLELYKLGCVVRMVVDSILPHAECGPNDHRKDAPPFMFLVQQNATKKVAKDTVTVTD